MRCPRASRRAFPATGLSQDQKRDLVEVRKRRLILLQGLLVVGMLTLRTAGFFLAGPLLARLSSSAAHGPASLLLTCLELVSSSVHPCIYIYFNERARKYFYRILALLLREAPAPDTELTLADPASRVDITR